MRDAIMAGVADVETLLREKMGLDAASIGASTISRAVQARRSAHNLKNDRAYFELVMRSEPELQALIEAVVVPETWFFRDRAAFSALTVVVADWMTAHPESVLRMLSLPCSTGEEPYAMAMALLDLGVPARRFRIDAVDISERVLTRARGAEYGRGSFRGTELGFRDRYFTPTTAGHHLAQAVRERVHFQQGNLFNADFLPGAEIYDVIFCRNVLIYFDEPTQARAFAVLARLLSPLGFLFVGSSETAAAVQHGFVSAKMPMAFAFRKAGAMPAPPPRRAPAPIRVEGPAKRHVAPPAREVRVTRPAVVSAPPSQVPPADVVKGELEEAATLADQGRFVDADARCEAHVRQHGPSAPAFYLMALVRDATGRDTDAAEYYRKALYLDPNHHETLVHFALLVERQGDATAARVLRTRARRQEKDRT
jgi:chemotaxis protein methyltransferase WspC